MIKKPVECLVQPGDGITLVLKAIESARRTIEIVIFRLDRREIERALAAAVLRGVHVHALTAFTNKGGEKSLRALEMRLLSAGVTVARTCDDLVRYHGKMMIIDRRELHLMAFNLTWLDVERSRSFGLICRDRKLVREAAKLFDADVLREPYTAGHTTFLVSPVNARKQLASFLKGAKKELLIYDPEVSDPEMVRLLEQRAKAGVDIKIIGKLAANKVNLTARKLHIRLHTRTIIRDGRQAFVGSQSLRTLELDSRREVGIIIRDPAAIALMAKTFREDWDRNDQELTKPLDAERSPEKVVSAGKVAKQAGDAVANDIGPVVESTIRSISGPESALDLNYAAVEATVRDAVKEAVKEVVRGFVEEAVEEMESATK